MGRSKRAADGGLMVHVFNREKRFRTPFFTRRSFLIAATGSAMALSGGRHSLAESLAAGESPAAGEPSKSNLDKIFKSVKWGMIKVDGSVADKFQLQKELGYDGMELISPSGLDLNEVRAASDSTGMPVHGVVDMKHWNDRLSSPDSATRDRGRQYLEQSIRDSKAFGGDTVLLVPGAVRGEDENHDHVWRRSIVEIRKVLPLASRLGVRILIENVWNGFCESPDQLRDYLDEIDSPWVGAYFDIGNVRKFGPSEDWIRTLGSRIVKLDVKDWGVDNGFCRIGDGDVNWPAVREALHEIGFSGWCTAEVAGGDRQRLADIAQRMDRALEL